MESGCGFVWEMCLTHGGLKSEVPHLQGVTVFKNEFTPAAYGEYRPNGQDAAVRRVPFKPRRAA